MRHARVIAHASAIHLADTYPAMTSWSPAFSVELKNQRIASVGVLGRGRCRFGVPCRLLDPGGGYVAAEVLVLPARESLGESLGKYLERCVDPDSLLAQQVQSLFAAAGLMAPDITQLSYAALARIFVAVRSNTLTPSMTDAVLTSDGSPLQQKSPPGTFRGSIFRRVASLGETDDWAPLVRNEVLQEIAALRRNLETANAADLVHRGCR
jgi:hypothetical protein